MTLNVVYIACYGRSGSTLLDILLCAHPRVCSLGELGFLWDEIDKANVGCACGEKVTDCSRWDSVVGDVARLWPPNRIANRSKFAEHWLLAIVGGFGRWTRTFNDANTLLLHSLRGSSNCDYVVDSSKTAYRFGWRPVALHRGTGAEVRLIHLLRNPRDVVRSCLKGKNTRLQQGNTDIRKLEVPITLVGWLLSNFLALLNGKWLGKSRYMRVDFDDLRDHPAATLTKIGSFIDVDLSSVVDQVNSCSPIVPGHMVAGNRMARQDEVRVIRGQSNGGPTLRRSQRLAIAILCGLPYKMLKVKMQLDKDE